MTILRGFKLSRITLVILVSLVSMSTFSSEVYCGDDEWVYVDSNIGFTQYFFKSIICYNR